MHAQNRSVPNECRSLDKRSRSGDWGVPRAQNRSVPNEFQSAIPTCAAAGDTRTRCEAGCRAPETVRIRTNLGGRTTPPFRLALELVTLASDHRRSRRNDDVCATPRQWCRSRREPFGSERISAVGPPRAIPTRAGPSRNTQVAPRCDRVPHAQNRSGPNECRRSDHGCRAPKKTGRVRTNLGARRTTGGMTLRQVRAPGCRRSKTRSGPNDPSGQISSDVTPDREPGVESERRQLTTPVFD